MWEGSHSGDIIAYSDPEVIVITHHLNYLAS